jgi:antibiotic biosynthesis monooxygenase (ABM) superfamily enzyme
MEETSLKLNKHFMALLTFLLLLPLVYFIPSFIALYISEDRFLVSLISVAIIVPLLSYCLMPMLLKLLANFSLT